MMRGVMVSEHESGVVVEVWVVPGSSRDEIAGAHGGALRVRTTVPPEGGRANRAVERLLGDALGSRRVAVISGGSSRRKRVLVEGVTMAEASFLLGLTSEP